jgi:hypothetical protein
MKRPGRLLRVLLGWALAAWAVWSTASAQTNVSAAAPQELPTRLLRDPFWPVGWAPPNFGQIGIEEGDRNALAKWAEARKQLLVTGLSRGADGKFVAILKGIGVVQEGDTVSVNYGDLTYKWRLRSISSDGIDPERIGAFPRK